MRPHLVVIGGGITGLAAAWTAARDGRGLPDGLDVTVLERDAVVGGKARSYRADGWLAEEGPGGYLSGRPAIEQLIDEAGLRERVVAANAAAANRFVYFNGALRRVVPNPLGLWRAGLLEARGALRLFGEPFVRTRREGPEESVWEFAARRIGAQAADRLVAPMTLGIYAGDARQLSLPSAFPRMAALEAEHGSLVRGLIAKRGKMSTGTLTSLRDGLQQLPLMLVARGRFTTRTSAVVRAIERTADGWRVSIIGAEPLMARVVVLAGEAWSSAELLGPIASDGAAALSAIPCPPVTVVSLGYRLDDALAVPRGFGVLIPRTEGMRMLGNLWDSYIFPGRSPEQTVHLRAMLGGAVDASVSALDEPSAARIVRNEVRRLYGISAAPVFTHVTRWTRAIPQYTVGHARRVATVRDAARAHPGLFIAGSALDGVAFADAAASGVATGESAVRWLAEGT